jgi:hypothetical protein
MYVFTKYGVSAFQCPPCQMDGLYMVSRFPQPQPRASIRIQDVASLLNLYVASYFALQVQ